MLRCVSKRTENMCPHQHLHVNARSSSIHNSPKNSANVHHLMNGQISVVSPYNGILFSSQKEWGRFLENNFPSVRNQIQEATRRIIPLLWNVQNRQICEDRKQTCSPWPMGRGRGGNGEWLLMGTRFLLEVLKLFWNCMHSSVNDLKTTELYTFKRANFMAHESFLNKKEHYDHFKNNMEALSDTKYVYPYDSETSLLSVGFRSSEPRQHTHGDIYCCFDSRMLKTTYMPITRETECWNVADTYHQTPCSSQQQWAS